MSLIRKGYTDVNRAFLQAFMSRRALSMDDIRPILAAILSADNREQEVASEDINDRTIQSYIATANGEIHDFDLEIRSTMDQKKKTRVFALINTASDELVQIATTHTADEIAFFKRVLDEMFDTNNTQSAEIMAVTSFQALKLTKNPTARAGPTQASQGTQSATAAGLTIKGAEDCLDAFVAEGWLEKSPENWYSLSPRALMELTSYLTQTYNTPADDSENESESGTRSGAVIERIKNCHGCKEIITVGFRCQTKTCGFRLHELCATQYFRAQRGLKECPTCGATWTANDAVGEQAAKRRVSGAGSGGGRKVSSNNGPGGREGGGTVAQARPVGVREEEGKEEGEDEDEDEEGEEEGEEGEEDDDEEDDDDEDDDDNEDEDGAEKEGGGREMEQGEEEGGGERESEGSESD